MKNKRKQLYYGVYSLNGLGIYDSEEAMVMASDWFGDYKSKAFDYRDDAEEFAISGYNKLVQGKHVGYHHYELQRINWFINTKQIIKGQVLYK